MTMARPARVLPIMLNLQNPPVSPLAGLLLGGASYISSHRRCNASDYPYRQRTFTAIHGYGSKRGSTGI